MPTNTLLEFLLGLFANPGAAQQFRDDPEGALEGAGLAGLCTEDVEAVMPVLHDFGPVSFDREYNTGGNSIHSGGNSGGGGGNADHAHAVQQLTHVLNNYSYIDDRDTVLENSISQNIWADGDVHQIFDQSHVVASGDQANAAGDDLDVEDSYNTEIKVEDSFNDSHDDNSEVKIEDSWNDNTDNSVEVKIEDSGNDNSDHSTEDSHDVEIEDSFNPELEIEVEDAFNYEDESDTQTNTDSVVVQDNETEVEESIILVP